MSSAQRAQRMHEPTLEVEVRTAAVAPGQVLVDPEAHLRICPAIEIVPQRTDDFRAIGQALGIHCVHGASLEDAVSCSTRLRGPMPMSRAWSSNASWIILRARYRRERTVPSGTCRTAAASS